MAKSKGWIRTDRTIRDSWVWKDKPFSKGQAWMDLLLRVNHERRTTMINGSVIQIEAGSMITSFKQLANDWGWNVKTVRSFIGSLEGDQMVTTERTARWTSLTIVNWAKFQNVGSTERTTERTGERTTERSTDWSTERTQTRNNNNYKQYNNARARDARNMIGQFQLAPGMRNDYSSMIADLERANEERNRQERLSGGSWEDGYDEWEEEA